MIINREKKILLKERPTMFITIKPYLKLKIQT